MLIEYGGKWKMLHYYARNFYSPVHISPVLNPDQSIDVYLINDSLPVFSSNEINVTSHHHRHVVSYDNALRYHDHGGRKQALVYSKSMHQSNGESDRLQRTPVLQLVMYTWKSLKPLKTWTMPLTNPVISPCCFNQTRAIASDFAMFMERYTVYIGILCITAKCSVIGSVSDHSATAVG